MLRPHGMGQRRPTTDVITRHWVHHHQPIQAAVSVPLRKLLSQLATERISMTAHQCSAALVTGQQPLPPPLLHQHHLIAELNTGLHQRGQEQHRDSSPAPELQRRQGPRQQSQHDEQYHPRLRMSRQQLGMGPRTKRTVLSTQQQLRRCLKPRSAVDRYSIWLSQQNL